MSGALLTLQGISEVFRCLICIKEGGWTDRASAYAEETEKILMRTAQKGNVDDVI